METSAERALSEINAQKQINRVVRKYKNKKVVLYGAGIYALCLVKQYDLSGLDVIGIADKRFEKDDNGGEYLGYKTLKPSDLLSIEADVILLTVQEPRFLEKYLYNNIVKKRTKKIKITPLIKKEYFAGFIQIEYEYKTYGINY